MESLSMKIAVVTDDGKTISAHFGRARHYLVVTVDEGKISGRETRDKAGHQDFVQGAPEEGGHEDQHSHEHHHEHHHEHGEGHGHGAGARERHARMFAAITDCSVVLARGMGAGAYEGLQDAGIRPIVTTARMIDEALHAYIAGNLEDHPEKLH
jgi:predicted Fe-Mo cluster-binding NifX family protein